MDKNNEERSDILIITKFVVGAILTGMIVVLIYLAINRQGGFLPVIWSLAFLICGGGIGFLFGIPRILTDDIVPESPPLSGTALNEGKKLRSNYRPSTHLERISEWLTTLIVGLTLVQWQNVVNSFNQIAGSISQGINPEKPELNVSFAGSIMLYFSVTGFIGAYLLTRIYLSRIFERSDVGSSLRIDDAERNQINKADLSNPRNLELIGGLENVARRILGTRLDQLNSLEDIIAWSKAQLAAGNFENAVQGYEKAVNIAPSDIQLRLEYNNALYFAGESSSDPAVKLLNRTKAEEQLLKAQSLLSLMPNPEVKMKVYRALTYFYLFSDLQKKDFEKVIQYGEIYDQDSDPRKIVSVGLLVNIACAYGQKYKWLSENGGSESEKKLTREKALEYIRKILSLDQKGTWLMRLQTLLRSDIPKDSGDNDLEVFEKDNEFRSLLKLQPVIPE